MIVFLKFTQVHTLFIESFEVPRSWHIISFFHDFAHRITLLKMRCLGFPGGAVVENPPANAGDTGSSPGPGRSHMPQSN